MGRVIALLFHDRGTRRGWVVSSTPWPHFTPGKDPVPIYRRLVGPQGRSGWAENLVPTGIRSQTVQPVVSRYTNWATQPTEMWVTQRFVLCPQFLFTGILFERVHVWTELDQARQTCRWAKRQTTVYDTCAWEAPGLRVVLPSPCSTEAEVGEMVLVGGVTYCCNRFRLNFSSCTRSQFSLLYNFLVANRTFKKMCILKCYYCLHWWWLIENKNICDTNNNKKQ